MIIDPLVSIIIPTYNRENLIGETLESILDQTYSNWECIIVDDGSTDYTVELLELYCERDFRFQYYNRLSNLPKGANACRNYGFKKSNGEYIIWFDSDDLMLVNHIQLKVEAISKWQCDFIVAQTQNFSERGFQVPYTYEKKEYGIIFKDFVLRNILWYMCDTIIFRPIAEKIRFNEELKFWQDYNYFCKMLIISENGKYLDLTLSYRRLHNSTMTTENTKVRSIKLLEVGYYTFVDIHKNVSKSIKEEMTRNLINISFSLAKSKQKNIFLSKIFKIVNEVFGLNASLNFAIALVTGYFFRKGEVILKFAKN